MKTRREILEQNGLNWNVVKKPLFYTGEQINTFGVMGVMQKSTSYYGIVREDTGEVFTTCKEGYTPTQNETIIDTMQEIAGENDLEIIKAIPINEGRKIVIQMQRPDNTFSIGKEHTKQFIYAINGHDGSSSLKFGFMNEVLFCQNQFAWMSNSALSGYRHTESIQDKVKQLPSIINFSDQEEKIFYLQEFSMHNATADLMNDLVDYLTNTDKLVGEIHTRTKNIRNDLESCIVSEVNRIGSTKWGLFNGVTRYTTHQKSSPKRKYGQQESILIGSSGKMNEKAFNFIKNY